MHFAARLEEGPPYVSQTLALDLASKIFVPFPVRFHP
jgi:hypothetical protein